MKRRRDLPGPSPPTLPSPNPGSNEGVLSALAGYTSEGLFSSLPSPLVLHGRAEGKAACMTGLLAAAGCVFSFVDVSTVETTRELFGVMVEGVGRSLVDRLYRSSPLSNHSTQKRKEVLTAFFQRVCSPKRGRVGWAAGATLASWCEGGVRETFVEALLLTQSSTDHPSGHHKSHPPSRASILNAMPSPKADTPEELATALSALCRLTVGDILMSPPQGPHSNGSLAQPIGVWLVLDGADSLAATLPTLLPTLASLRHDTGAPNLSMAFLATSGAPIEEAFRGIPRNTPSASGCPLYLDWCPPTVDAVQRALEARALPLLDHSPFTSREESVRLYKEFLGRMKLALGGVLGWRQLGECAIAVDTLWPAFCEPLRGRLSVAKRDASDRSKAPPAPIDPHLLYRTCRPAIDAFKGALLSRGVKKAGEKPPTREFSDVEALPFFTRLLLISAFIAGHNPPPSDVRYFSRGLSGKRGAGGNKLGGGAASTASLALGDGPFAFSVERLFAMANTLSSALLGPSVSLSLPYTALYEECLGDLERMQLVVKCGGAGLLLYSSLIPPSMAFAVSKTLCGSESGIGWGNGSSKDSLSLEHYLHEF